MSALTGAQSALTSSGVGMDAGARVPAASAPVVVVIRRGPFLSVAMSANISADAHIGVACVGVVLQDSAVSSVSDVSVGMRDGPVSSQAEQVVSLVTSASAAACAIASVVGSTVPCVSTAASEGSAVSTLGENRV